MSSTQRKSEFLINFDKILMFFSMKPKFEFETFKPITPNLETLQIIFTIGILLPKKGSDFVVRFLITFRNHVFVLIYQYDAEFPYSFWCRAFKRFSPVFWYSHSSIYFLIQKRQRVLNIFDLHSVIALVMISKYDVESSFSCMM